MSGFLGAIEISLNLWRAFLPPLDQEDIVVMLLRVTSYSLTWPRSSPILPNNACTAYDVASKCLDFMVCFVAQ